MHTEIKLEHEEKREMYIVQGYREEEGRDRVR